MMKRSKIITLLCQRILLLLNLFISVICTNMVCFVPLSGDLHAELTHEGHLELGGGRMWWKTEGLWVFLYQKHNLDGKYSFLPLSLSVSPSPSHSLLSSPTLSPSSHPLSFSLWSSLPLIFSYSPSLLPSLIFSLSLPLILSFALSVSLSPSLLSSPLLSLSTLSWLVAVVCQVQRYPSDLDHIMHC